MEHSHTTAGALIPYVPFATFCTALDYLKSHGTPDKIDSSVFPNFAGGTVSHLLLSMKFLGLIDEKGLPRPILAQLVDEKTRKSTLSKLIPQAYANLFQHVDLAKASPSTLDEALRLQKVKGATHRKARAFLLKAAQFAGLPISSHLTKRTRTSSPRPNNASKKTREDGGTKTPPTPKTSPAERAASPANNSISIKLPDAGGTLVLSGDFNFFALRGTERELVFKLSDMMEGFGTKRKVTETK